MYSSPYDRPTKHERRSCGATITLTPTDDQNIREAAGRCGLSISSFIARAASIAAMDELAKPATV